MVTLREVRCRLRGASTSSTDAAGATAGVPASTSAAGVSECSAPIRAPLSSNSKSPQPSSSSGSAS
eukprot:7382733-Prymnesium_polylepis.1